MAEVVLEGSNGMAEVVLKRVNGTVKVVQWHGEGVSRRN